jgi:hypothetical protein
VHVRNRISIYQPTTLQGISLFRTVLTGRSSYVKMATLRVAELSSSTILGMPCITMASHTSSANGTFVNGEKVGKGNKLLLQTGLEITLLQAKTTPKLKIRSYYLELCCCIDLVQQKSPTFISIAATSRWMMILETDQGSTTRS